MAKHFPGLSILRDNGHNKVQPSYTELPKAPFLTFFLNPQSHPRCSGPIMGEQACSLGYQRAIRKVRSLSKKIAFFSQALGDWAVKSTTGHIHALENCIWGKN
jgi:hypothetical protein